MGKKTGTDGLGKQALLSAANLSLPKFQIVAMDANLGCDHCRQRVTQILSVMAGSRDFGVDICKKRVIITGGVRFKLMASRRNVSRKNAAEPSVASSICNFLIRTLNFLCCCGSKCSKA